MGKVAAPAPLARTHDMRQMLLVLCAVCAILGVTATPAPDSGGMPPLPGPGLSYGGIPYGSMSGNVAEFFRRQATPSGRRSNFGGYSAGAVDYSPIEQWL